MEEEDYYSDEIKKEEEEKPVEKKPRGFKLFDDAGKTFTLRKQIIEPATPKAKGWNEICLDFLKDESEITNFQQNESRPERKGRGRRTNIFDDFIRQNQKAKTDDDRKREPTIEEKENFENKVKF